MIPFLIGFFYLVLNRAISGMVKIVFEMIVCCVLYTIQVKNGSLKTKKNKTNERGKKRVRTSVDMTDIIAYAFVPIYLLELFELN